MVAVGGIAGRRFLVASCSVVSVVVELGADLFGAGLVAVAAALGVAVELVADAVERVSVGERVVVFCGASCGGWIGCCWNGCCCCWTGGGCCRTGCSCC